MTVDTLSYRTLGNEEELPRVPLPTLEESCARFLDWCAPLLTEPELVETRRAVAGFLSPASVAHRLQAKLERYDESEGVHSWLDAFWAERYLGRRDRIALNANFFSLFESSDLGQIERAARLIASSLEYKLLLHEGQLPPVVRDGRAFSMEQHQWLFATTRIPGRVQDTVREPTGDERHVVVFHRGRPFRMDVIGATGRPHTVDELASGLRLLTALDPAGQPSSVGHLTTKARADWAQSRRALLGRRANARALAAIETALFCVCLDDAVPGDALEACDLLLHGDGGNRWFDKSLSFVVFRDGTAGTNVEHSRLDGITALDFVDALLEEHSRESRAEPQGVPAIEPIEFELDGDLVDDIRGAAAAFAAHAADTATAVLTIEDFGADRIKQLQISPDAFVQMAFQLAHKRTRGLVGATYESIATRQFRHGRTEAMRVVTHETVAFVAAMEDPEIGAATRRATFRAAAGSHVRRANECRAGRAPEQHLWELQMMQRRNGDGEPLALYESPGWLVMRNDYLSTSSAPSRHVRYGGFGPTGDRCIGISYMLFPDRFSLHLSARRSLTGELRRFVGALPRILRELDDLLPGG